MGWDGHEAGRGCRHDGASPSYKCFTCMPRHFCYPWLTPACFALLLACSCGRFWCQLLALVSPNCVFEAVWARPLVRPAVLERSSDHLGFVKALSPWIARVFFPVLFSKGFLRKTSWGSFTSSACFLMFNVHSASSFTKCKALSNACCSDLHTKIC